MPGKQRIAVVSDSTADIPPDIAERYPIYVVPAILNIEGKSIEDGSGISRQEFYERLPHMNPLPTTSAPSVGSFIKMYERILRDHADLILSLHPPAILSGVYNAARLAAENFEERVVVIDSGLVTLGLGFQAMAALEATRQGAPMEAVVAQAQATRQRTQLVALLDTFEYVRRSGRVSWAKAALGTLLNIKPFVSMKDGVVLRLGETRTRLKGIERLRHMLESIGALERLAILHSNIEADAHRFLASLNVQLASEPLVVNVTTIIGTHVGPKGLGFVAVRRE